MIVRYAYMMIRWSCSHGNSQQLFAENFHF